MAIDPTEELIREIFAKHGVAVSRDDPILIVQTMNARLLQDGQEAQQKLLEQFKSELEEISTRWGADAKAKAERILNAALGASKETMARVLEDGAREVVERVKAEIQEAHKPLDRALTAAHRVAAWNLAASVATALAAIGAALLWLLH